MTGSLLIREARIVGGSEHPVTLRIADGRVIEVSATLDPVASEEVLDADGRWLIPGLWDEHVHMRQWAEASSRLDLSRTQSAGDVLAAVAKRVAELKASPLASAASPLTLVGAGFRISEWPDTATTSALDAVTEGLAVALISGDGHCGWLNSRALQFFGLAGHEGLLDENEWFAVYTRLSELTQLEGEQLIRLYRAAIRDAHSRGIVGITDLEYAPNYLTWPELVAHNVGSLRVRAGFYPDRVEDVTTRGLRTGDVLAPLVTLGSLKIIADGSLGTLTAYCCDSYSTNPEFPRGKLNYDQDELTGLLSRAHRHGLEVAFHAIGDAAIHAALDAFAHTGAKGSIEHTQLILRNDIPRLASLGLVASVQPAHLRDDYLVAEQVWGDRMDRCYLFASMHRHGVTLALGSDAPVSPLNPWLAMDAAVTRSTPGGAMWNPDERLSASQALFASTHGAGPVTAGSLGDVVLLDDNPLTAPLMEVRTAATVLDGMLVFSRI